MQTWQLVLVPAYFVGAIPVGWLLCWAVEHIDLRTVGSGSTGATQVGRVLGKKWEMFTMALDAFKSAIVILAAKWLMGSEHAALICGLAAVAGHCYSLVLYAIPIRVPGEDARRGSLQSGKGVASTLGVALCFYPIHGLAAFVVWFVVKKTLAMRTAENTAVASMAAVWFFALVSLIFTRGNWWFVVASFAMAIHVVLTHRGNIKRLMTGAKPGSGGQDERS